MASASVINPSLFPPFTLLSYSASARKPFASSPVGGVGCGVKLPNNSRPLSTVPLPLRSKANHASSDPEAVHDQALGMPLPSKSKLTPPFLSVRLNPLPIISTRIGDPTNSQQQVPMFATYPDGQFPQVS